ncbi:MAG TPA: PIG-L family deacetylase [Vicinamibacterales bacterium]|nr:PIG-L family deacetylase [Vicinamibacterales bacterium]
MRRTTAIVLLALVAVATAPAAQHRLQPVTTMRGEPALELVLRKLDTVGNFMMTTAHPDDENNAMLAYYAHGKGYRISLVAATRGEGGQNEIGPELFEALSVLRTEELLAAHRFDGAEQYFTRAVDFGYSFSIEETLEKWGKQEILGDYVRMIRTIRPDVIVGFVFDGAGGGQHHQASSRLTAEAFRAAADPNAFPEQMAKDGLRPWQPRKFYYTAGFGGPGPGGAPALTGEGATKLLAFGGGDVYDPLLGRTYGEIAGEARSMHKCQGMSQLLPLPAATPTAMGPGAPRGYRLRDTVLSDGVNRTESEPFDGLDTRITSLAQFAGEQPPQALTSRLERVAAAVLEARAAFDRGGSTATVPALLRGLGAVRELRSSLSSLPISDQARFEIAHRLRLKDTQFGEALMHAADVRLEAIARDALVVAGQTVQIDLMAANRSGVVPVMISRRALTGFDAQAELCKDDVLMRGSESRSSCTVSPRVPANARLTAAHFKYAPDAARFIVDPDVPAGLPFRPTPFTAQFLLNIAGVDVTTTIPVQFRSEGNIFSGEKRGELHVVPTFAVTVSPEIAVVPLPAGPTGRASDSAGRDVRVTVTNHARGAAQATVQLELPRDWRATPASAPVAFTREDESMTVRFRLVPDFSSKPRDVAIKARVNDGTTTYTDGYQVVEYPHTTRRHVLRTPEVIVKTLDVKVKPNLTVGYVMGVGDEVPTALEQLGARVELLTADELAWGDLSRFDVMMTGVRAYERRADLRANNQRLLDYARAGGTVIVNYNKFEFNEAQYGPFAGKVGRERVTDENSVVRVLQPQHPIFTTPNRITEADWKGWRQERGLYFFDTAGRDPQIVDLLEFEDPFPFNNGGKLGALVEAKVGRGRWLYVGLGLWRQLPAGTDGAYRLMANMISLGGR